MAIELIYCGGSNRRFADIAVAAGYRYGAQLPRTIYAPLFFADQDWKRPNRAAYMAALAQHRPIMATVMDIEYPGQLDEALSWAEEAAQYVERVLLIPKCDVISQLPRRIGGADVVLAFSVPTRYGGTPLPLWEFAGWPVHLLGGAPHVQMQYALHLQSIADVVSVDGNYFQMKATRFCEHWQAPGQWVADGRKTEHDAPYAAFERSCQNMRDAWRKQC